jgi:hypothetical protein
VGDDGTFMKKAFEVFRSLWGSALERNTGLLE